METLTRVGDVVGVDSRRSCGTSLQRRLLGGERDLVAVDRFDRRARLVGGVLARCARSVRAGGHRGLRVPHAVAAAPSRAENRPAPGRLTGACHASRWVVREPRRSGARPLALREQPPEQREQRCANLRACDAARDQQAGLAERAEQQVCERLDRLRS